MSTAQQGVSVPVATAGFDPAGTTGEALTGLLGALFASMQATLPAVLTDTSPIPLHEYRVALRRLRSLLRAFRKLFEPAWYARARNDLRWLAAGSSRLRDLDVLLASLSVARAPLADDSERAAVLAFVMRERARELARLRRRCATLRHRRMQDDWQDLRTCLRRDSARVAAPVTRTAVDAISRSHARLSRNSAALADQPAYTALHELRKDGKRLRYLVDAFASLYPQRTVKQTIKDLKRVQDLLGEICDRHAQAALLTAWLGGPLPPGPARRGLEALHASCAEPPGRHALRALHAALARLTAARRQAALTATAAGGPA